MQREVRFVTEKEIPEEKLVTVRLRSYSADGSPRGPRNVEIVLTDGEVEQTIAMLRCDGLLMLRGLNPAAATRLGIRTVDEMQTIALPGDQRYMIETVA